MPESSTLTDFLNATALYQAGSWGMTYMDEEIYSINEDQAEKIWRKYRKKKYELNQCIRMSFYGNSDDEVILMTENGGRIREMEEFMREMESEG